jgi:hypothetical protein
MSPREFFAGSAAGLAIFEAVHRMVTAFGEVDVRVTKSQIALRRRRAFAYVWRPGQYVSSDVPAVLSIPLSRKLRSDRFKEIAHPSPKVWMHHLEVGSAVDLDDEVRGWLRSAFDAAG